MDDTIRAVLDIYHAQMRDEVPLGPDTAEPVDRLMLPVGEEAGQFINILANSLTRPTMLEIGTSYGYSGIWLGEAARATGGRLTTLELRDFKAAHAKAMAEQAGVAEHIDFQIGDALALIAALPGGIDFVLLDLWKPLYVPCLDAFYPKLNPGAIIVADNMISPGGEDVKHYGRAVRAKPGMTSVLLPVGQGLEISRYEG
jgi:predicted O-methyltransferase YrrM